MQTKVQKWGNSYAVRLPKPLVIRLGLRTGSIVHVEQQGNVVVVKQVPAKKVTMKDWEKYLIPSGRKNKRNISGHVDEIVYGVSRR
jgi:antitoxin component of MazEF toxin-antitoxin module